MDSPNIISIHQPAFIPWLGIIESMFATDILVLYDDVQFEKGGVQNRNKIKTQHGSEWLTIPVSVSHGTLINKVRIAENYTSNTIIKVLHSSYGQSPYFKKVFPELVLLLKEFSKGDLLYELNVKIIKWIASVLKCPCKIILSSSLKVNNLNRLGRLAEICTLMKATHIYTGTGMLDYCNPEDFVSRGIIPIFHNYQSRHVVYQQCFQEIGFIPCLSVIDLLFNIGYEQSSELLKSSAKKILRDALKYDKAYFRN